ncbi:sulfotransferase [Formosa sp. L2A11]|uniref:sulfotransferase family protein n=1 Tax=Formosa sp. L2A11 TaxID=2686363 RepID=UPI00131A8B81|nr:sulfotransferase [Formosa sp. L2A11]
MEDDIQDGSNLIFILSLPRSGSTLLQMLLSNNDKVSTASEPWILLPLISFLKSDFKIKANGDLSRIAVEDYLRLHSDSSLANEVKKIALNFYAKATSKDAKYFLDKTPRYYEFGDEIKQLFPKAKIIILKRDLSDVVSSICKTWDIDTIYKMRDYKRDLLAAPKLMQEFQDANINNPNVRTVFYESLVDNPEAEVKMLYEWLGLDFNPDFIDFTNNKKANGVLGDPIGVKANRKPKKNLNSRKILEDHYWKDFSIGYLNHLGKTFLDLYGYSDYPQLKPTADFNLFQYSCFHKRTSFKQSMSNILKNMKYYFTTSKYKKEIFN